VCLAVYTRGRTVKSSYALMAGGVLFAGCLSGIYFAVHSYQAERNGLQTMQARNTTIAQVLQSHRESTLVGDYWRVFPIKLAARRQLAILPLNACTTPRPDLSSRTWQVDLRGRSFAYLLTLDSHGPDFPACSLREVTAMYGQPNAITVIAGTTDQPQEVLLFYDHGETTDVQARQAVAAEGPAESALTPVPVDQLLNVNCPTGNTIMQIVAHEDDDLLFMNPDLEHSIDAGDCIRTVYVTAGDAGGGKFYWLGREQGSEAAYAKLAQVPNIWLEQTVRLAPHEFATIASPSRDPRLTLIFLHLPDGNVNGQGFARSADEGLAKLEAGNIRAIRSVDGQSEYTYSQLQAALRNLINAYSPDMMRTQLPENASETYADHSDHLAVGRVTTAAFRMYRLSHPYSTLTYYMGYPVHDQPQNVSGTDLDRKEQAFLTYSHYDGGTCQNAEQCSTGVYSIYLQRQYSQAAQLP
jgi:LmbE family N-acetylglucosaminyl deacetylase